MVDLVMTGDSYDEAAAAALAHARSTGATLIPAFDAVSTVVGQATVALEILEQLDSPPDVVVLPVGGGGLLAGCATWLRIRPPPSTWLPSWSGISLPTSHPLSWSRD